MRRLPLVAGAAFVLAYLFDPNNGRIRRRILVERATGFFRQAFRRETEKPQPNDATLAQKVKSEVFRPADSPKGDVSVNAEDGIVILRGEVEKPELIAELEQRVRKVQGVRDVENLLHAPGTEPQMHEAHAKRAK